MLEAIHVLCDYNGWANQRILETASLVTMETLLSPAGANDWSLHGTLVHLMSSQWIWLERWRGTSPPGMLKPTDYPALNDIRSRWATIEKDTAEFLAALTEDNLGRVVRYINTKGKAFAYPLWKLMLHQANHGTQHRSEAAVLLTQFGHSPGEMDLVAYLSTVPQH